MTGTRAEQPTSTVDQPGLTVPADDAYVLRFGTYNLREFRKHNNADERDRCTRVVDVIRDLDVDVLAVQEIYGTDRDDAAANLARLAADTGMQCHAPPGQAVIASGGRGGLHVGMLWWPDLPIVSAKTYERPAFLSPLAKVVLDHGGRQHQLASHHATPFGRSGRADGAEEVVAAMTRPDLPGLLGHDANGISADRRTTEGAGRGELYDPDPYTDAPWFADLIYQCQWTDHDHWADRTAGDVYLRGGFYDAAAALDTPWQATAGHWPTCQYGARGIRRRIDIIRATAHVLPALVDIAVHRTELALSASDFPEHGGTARTVDPTTASDHLPVVVTYDPEKIDYRYSAECRSQPNRRREASRRAWTGPQ